MFTIDINCNIVDIYSEQQTAMTCVVKIILNYIVGKEEFVPNIRSYNTSSWDMADLYYTYANMRAAFM